MIDKKIDLSRKIGVLGGGQLGRMLQEEALLYGVDLYFLDNDIKAPCSIFKGNFTHGSYKDSNSVIQFGKDKDILTIEIEHINTEALEQLSKYDKLVIPSVDVIRMIQNKALQKNFLKEHDIPTSDFIVNDAKTISPDIAKDWFPFVQKSQLDGYDGKGVVIIHDETQLEQQLNAPSLLEKLIDIEKELAVTIAIEQNGKAHLFPICEMVFDPKLNLVDYLIAPANIEEKITKKVNAIANKLAKALKSPGLFSVEFFLTKKGEVLVNEIAPRAHNSAHYTIEGCNISQYQAQLRILLGLPIPEIKMKGYAGMINLIGEEQYIGAPYVENLQYLHEQGEAHLHLYGKKETKPGRKMGHITVLNTNKSKLITQLHWIKENIKIKS
jgi:5-(carboxyamino)imidazole ribonucleotide synthase